MLHKLAFAEGMRQVFGVDTNIDVIKHHGSTDPLILVSVLAHHGVPHDQVGMIVSGLCFCRFTTAGQTPSPDSLAGHLPSAHQRSLARLQDSRCMNGLSYTGLVGPQKVLQCAV